MTTVTREDVTKSIIDLGIQQGDTIIVHSSFKSMGYVEGGAETVVGGILDALGSDGTLVFPTLVQKNFTQVYETWHLDKPSDVGYLTNYFRKRPGSLRSDQATHSVAACGKNAVCLTQTHGQSGPRIGCYGTTAFSADSPWEKMYRMDAKIVMLGVDAKKTTMKHLAEHIYVNKLLDSVKAHPNWHKLVGRLYRVHENYIDSWPSVYGPWVLDRLIEKNAVTYARLGDAQLMCYGSKDFVDTILDALFNEDWGVITWDNDPDGSWIKWKNWVEDCKKIQQELNH